MALKEIVKLPPFPNELEQVSDAQFALYADLIYSRTGVRVSSQKKTLLSNRLRRRLRSTGIDGFDEYFQQLKRLQPHDPEWEAFLQEITTHETYLFRDPPHWNWFRNIYLPACSASIRGEAGKPSLRMWSAACSTGDEAFTAASCIAACMSELSKWKIEILGTDIGVGAVKQAARGLFGERAMRFVPDAYRKSYFSKSKDDEFWQAKSILTNMTAFRQHNLLEHLPEKPFDLVFLKNVLIYFDRESKKKVIANVQQMVCPGGMLVVTAAEGVSDLMHNFIRKECWLYQRPKN
jgi:chemotaxis protein methyltransferase CheR